MPSELDLTVARRYLELAQARYPGAVGDLRIFGSRARGQAREESDLDLFVLLNQDDAKTRAGLQEMAWDVQVEFDFPYTVAPFVVTRAHFERLLGLERKIALDITQQGVPVD